MSNPNNCGARAVPHSYYFHEATGRKVSIFSSWRPEGSIVVREGYTIDWPDGTRGVLPDRRGPFATEQEAQACIEANPRFKGFQMD